MLPRFLNPNAYAIALLAPLLPLLVACGNGRSESFDDSDGGSVTPPDPHPHPTPNDDGGDPDGGCGSLVYNGPTSECTDPCGNPVALACLGGEWQCPEYGGTDDGLEFGCSEDAGTDGGCDDSVPFVCDQIPQCPEVWSEKLCIDGQWTCQWNGSCPVEDSGPPPPPPDFSCGNLACNPSTSYCQITTGGAILDDGGFPTGFSCLSLPSTCGAGTAASCGCVESGQELTPSCDCVSEGSNVIITCAVP